MGLPSAGALDEQLVILGIAGAHLEDIGRRGDVLDVVFAQNFGDDFEAGFLLGQRAGAGLPCPSLGIRRARCAACKRRRAESWRRRP